MTKLGIIEAGDVHNSLCKEYGTYFDMIQKWLEPSLRPEKSFNVLSYKNETLPNPNLADFWIISGSRHGVYDDLPWIKPLMEFILKCNSEKVPILGICFGHQIIAQAMGGQVMKSRNGWGIGVQKYHLKTDVNWFSTFPKMGVEKVRSYKGFAFHQDQILKLPPSARVISGNEFCPYAMLAYGDEALPNIITIQSHPEFSASFFRDLAKLRRNNPIPSTLVDSALTDLNCSDDNSTLRRTLISALLRSL